MNTEEEIYKNALNTYLNIGINYGANTIKNADVGDLQQLASDSFNAGYQLKLKQRDETIKQKDEEIKDLMSGQDQQAVDLVRLMDQVTDQKQMEVKLYDKLLKEQHKVKQLKEALRELSEANTAVLKSSTFERFLNISEENVQLKQALKNVLQIMDEYSNIEILLSMKDRVKLAEARKLLTK